MFCDLKNNMGSLLLKSLNKGYAASLCLMPDMHKVQG